MSIRECMSPGHRAPANRVLPSLSIALQVRPKLRVQETDTTPQKPPLAHLSGSVSVQTCERQLRKPVGAPFLKGELARSAVAMGCSAMPRRTLSTMSASLLKSKFTCANAGGLRVKGVLAIRDPRVLGTPQWV